MYQFFLPKPESNETITLNSGESLFILGANGVGKSSLMHRFSTVTTNSIRILAHRQAWMYSNSADISASQIKANSTQIRTGELHANSRYVDQYASQKPIMSLYNLMHNENIRSREISKVFESGNLDLAQKLTEFKSPIDSINELFSISNIPVKISLGDDDEFVATRSDSNKYGISELSDGERNALLICADVLTASQNCLILLDEPERHLHRSITSPLLSALFEKRKDCTFIVSTHDVYLPLGLDKARVLLVRGCNWFGKDIISNWDADLMPEGEDISEDVKREILGSKRNILFVEGGKKSLDKHIYQLLFPNLSVLAVGSCVEVEKSVDGIRNTESLHWINAYGLIDADDRTPDQIEKLQQKGIAALKDYSVESLYYNMEIVKLVARNYSKMTGQDSEKLLTPLLNEIAGKFKLQREQLCSRVCEKRVRQTIMSKLPKQKEIITSNNDFSINISLKDIFDKELSIFDRFIAYNDIDGLISRYPVRQTQILRDIAVTFGMDSKVYENTVRALVVQNPKAKEILINRLPNLTALINYK